MAKVVILGLGNDLFTDDAVGLRVARDVRSRLGPDTRIDVHETTETGLALLDFIVGYDSVVIVDAIQTGEQLPGFVHELEPEDFRAHASHSPHAVGVERLCTVGRSRGLLMPAHVRIFAIEIADPHTFGTDMTPAVEDAIGDAVDVVAERALEFADLPSAAEV